MTMNNTEKMQEVMSEDIMITDEPCDVIMFEDKDGNAVFVLDADLNFTIGEGYTQETAAKAYADYSVFLSDIHKRVEQTTEDFNKILEKLNGR